MGADLREPFDLGAEEIRIRVSRYGDDGKPACFQVWIDHRDRRVPRQVGILANPGASFDLAVERLAAAVDAHENPPPPVAEDDDLADLLGDGEDL